MTQKIEYIIRQLQKRSKRPIENLSLLRTYIQQSLKDGEAITFYDWECPPRFLDKAPDGREFINYNVDLGSIFRRRRIDQFTEFPRVVEKGHKEKAMLQLLGNLGLKFRFVKFIADTNAFYLTPESVAILGEKNIRRKFREFQNRIARIIRQYPAGTGAYLFTDVMREYKKVYDEAFISALQILNRKPRELITVQTWKQQLKRMKTHVGLEKPRELTASSKRVIASYAAEGVVFAALSKTKRFSNCVWMNLAEADKRTIEITNCLRVKRGMGELPMIFP